MSTDPYQKITNAMYKCIIDAANSTYHDERVKESNKTRRTFISGNVGGLLEGAEDHYIRWGDLNFFFRSIQPNTYVVEFNPKDITIVGGSAFALYDQYIFSSILGNRSNMKTSDIDIVWWPRIKLKAQIEIEEQLASNEQQINEYTQQDSTAVLLQSKIIETVSKLQRKIKEKADYLTMQRTRSKSNKLNSVAQKKMLNDTNRLIREESELKTTLKNFEGELKALENATIHNVKKQQNRKSIDVLQKESAKLKKELEAIIASEKGKFVINPSINIRTPVRTSVFEIMISTFIEFLETEFNKNREIIDIIRRELSSILDVQLVRFKVYGQNIAPIGGVAHIYIDIIINDKIFITQVCDISIHDGASSQYINYDGSSMINANNAKKTAMKDPITDPIYCRHNDSISTLSHTNTIDSYITKMNMNTYGIPVNNIPVNNTPAQFIYVPHILQFIYQQLFAMGNMLKRGMYNKAWVIYNRITRMQEAISTSNEAQFTRMISIDNESKYESVKKEIVNWITAELKKKISEPFMDTSKRPPTINNIQKIKEIKEIENIQNIQMPTDKKGGYTRKRFNKMKKHTQKRK